MNALAAQDLSRMLAAAAERLMQERDRLNRLDAALGDGDHGSSVSVAFAAAVEDIAALDGPGIAEIWLAASKALLNRMGGASGALFGTFFLRGVAGLRGKARLTKADMETCLAAGLAGVKARGNADPGDKTMVDALAPAVAAFAAADDFEGGWQAAAAAARHGADSTRDLVARHGRAKFLGERAIGHIDPGATSIALFFEAIRDYWRSEKRRGERPGRPPAHSTAALRVATDQKTV